MSYKCCTLEYMKNRKRFMNDFLRTLQDIKKRHKKVSAENLMKICLLLTCFIFVVLHIALTVIRIYKSGEEISTAENGKHSMIWRTEKNNSSIYLVNFIRYIKSRSNKYCCVSFYEKYNQCKIPFRTGNIINNYFSSRYLANTIDGISFQSLNLLVSSPQPVA